MLKTLLKKQMFEVWRGYFINAKTNKSRSALSTVAMFAFFIVLMVGVLGGMFGFLSFSICGPFASVGMGWLYYVILGLIGLVLGVFGSVFNTFSGLYMAKDNELLLSMPIPVKDIVFSRLINVYLLGLMYTSLALVPAIVIYWIFGVCSVASVLGGMLLLLTVSLAVFFLTCILGWCVARISTKVKNKSFVTVALSLLFIGGYYFVYFKAQELIQDLILNAVAYGEKIKGSAYGLYLFGRIGEGDIRAILIYLVAAVILTVLTVRILLRTFVKIATATGTVVKKEYKEKLVRQRSPFGAMLGKEFGRFTASPNYMLNCGLGILLIPALGILILVKGSFFVETLKEVFSFSDGAMAVLIAAALCLVAAMNDMVSPSVSLEGKSLWIAQSIPVRSQVALRAKMAMQLILTLPLMLFAAICSLTVLSLRAAEVVLFLLAPILYTFLAAESGLALNLKYPNVHWTNELIPVKQSASVTIALFGGWAYATAFGGLYLWLGKELGVIAYLSIADGITLIGCLLLFLWIERKGSKIFAAL